MSFLLTTNCILKRTTVPRSQIKQNLKGEFVCFHEDGTQFMSFHAHKGKLRGQRLTLLTLEGELYLLLLLDSVLNQENLAA